MRTTDIAARNLANAGKGSYFGYVDVDFLSCPPFVMFSNDDCSVAYEILARGGFERGSLDVWLKLCAVATAALDIGAYTGIFALSAARARPDLPVLAFEPNPFTCARLRVNRAVNEAWNVTDRFAAVGAPAGLVKLNWLLKKTRGLSSVASLGEISGVPPEMIESAVAPRMPITVNDLPAGSGGHIVIKIDVEGAELDVFGGIASLLPLKPDIILESFNPKACARIADLLAPYNYTYGLIDEETGRIHRQDTLKAADPGSTNRNQLLSARRYTMALAD